MDPIVTGATANLSSEAAKGIFKEAKRHIRYVRIYKRNVDEFEEKLNMLMVKRAGVQQEVDAAKRNTEKIKADVEDWCDRVDKKIEEEEKKVKELEDKAKNKCFVSLCPNIKCRYQLSRKAEEGANVVDGLLQQGEFNRVSYRDVPEDIVDRPTKDFEAFKSREKVFNDIMEALKDATIGIIGVYGMAGVGKTTLVNEVARQAKKEKLFDAVVISVVNQTPDILKIQDQIADSLGLKFEEQSTTGRAHRLCERLKKEKEILVVLDDLWARLDLEEVGIPFYPERKTEVEIPYGDESKGCKIQILLTSRDLNVLTNGMEAQKNFPVGVLDKEEAWDLFKKMAGDNVESPELRSTANDVVERCAGLPVAIVTVGRALRNKSTFAWKDALRELQRPSPTNFMGIPEYVYSAIQFSYHHLKSPEHKRTFLLCSLLGHHASIQGLLKNSMGLRLFDGVNSVEETRDRLLTVVSDLKASCVLRDSYSKDRVDMHDLVCDVALAIASRDNNVFALKPEGFLKCWPDGDAMEKCTMISLQFADISHFPKELRCPQLSFLYIGNKDSSVEMPVSFFIEMKHLRVLHLTNMHFSISLPSSISFLTNLRTLCLTGCVLGDIALVGELKNLEILSLLKSDIEQLPKEIGQLVQLRLFDLSGCTKLKIVPPGLLSSLSRLEELYLGNSFVGWEVEKHVYQRTNATLAELKLLSRKLTTLEIHIPDNKIMPGDLFFEKLDRYKIFIGKAWDWSGEDEYSRTLKLELNRSIDHLDDGIKVLLKKTEDLYLDDMKGAKVALHGLIDEEGFHHLKKLHIQNCLDIQYIVDDNGAADENESCQLRSLTLQSLPQLVSFSHENKRSSTSQSQHELPLFGEKIVFPCLKNLHLSSINVERIWHHQISNKSFCTHENLTSLIVEGCGNLKHLLSSSMARTLANLKNFQIVKCKCLREVIIFSKEEGIENQQVVLFPQLNSLIMKNLPHLMGFCFGDYKIVFPSLKLLSIQECPKLEGFMYKSTMEDSQRLSPQAIFDKRVAFPSLEKLRIVHLRNMKMIWHNQLFVNSFCNLTDMIVEHCNELVSIFPGDMWNAFQKLETLRVSNCGSLEEIFEVQSLNMEETHVVATGFRELYIKDLPKLKHVWSKDPQGILTFQNLCFVQVWDCWSLKYVFPASVARDLRQLKDLQINRCGVEEIVSKEEGSETSITFAFDQLTFLALWNLPNLKWFYPGLHVTKWPMLEKLEAYHCNKVKIFDTDGNDEDGQHDSPTQQQSPVFLFEKVVTRLKEVSLNGDDIAMISNSSKFSRGFFHEIKALKVRCYHDDSSIFPITFLERFNNLENLEVGCCTFKELFPNEGATALVSLKKLRLGHLYNLKRIWKQEPSQLENVLPNLETLEVHLCRTLISLGLSLEPFQNLMTLDVWNCKMMINLVTSSAAVQSLMQLKTLKIRECESMKEIITNKGGEATDDIVFKRLKSLELWNLPSLKFFCSSNHKFNFPSLEHVIVIQCPELEIFCKGVLNVPMLRSVQATVEDKKGHWGGDLNSTVKQLYTKKVGYQGIEYLLLSDFSKSIDIWKENFHETLYFTNLTVLEVKDFSSLTYILTTSMALSLVQLKEIKVKNCRMMEQIIRNEGAEEAITSRIMLPRLGYITLQSCSSLTSFFLGSNTLECPSLRGMVMVDCPKMSEFSSAFPRKQDMERIGGVNAPFFSDKPMFHCLESLRLSSINIERIWPQQCSNKSFCSHENLTNLIVEGCGNLKNLLSTSMARGLVNLKNLQIVECRCLREILVVSEEGDKDNEIVIFPQLNSLKIKNLQHLIGFCFEDYNIIFPSLKLLEIEKCPALDGFIYKSTIEDNQRLPSQALFDEKSVFHCLESLHLSSINIERIWPQQRSNKSFCSHENLTNLIVEGCGNLQHLLSSSMARGLVNLKNLQIVECRCLREIIVISEEEDKDNEIVIFPQLNSLKIKNLQHLIGFCFEDYNVVFPSLKLLEIEQCPTLEGFIYQSAMEDNQRLPSQALFDEKMVFQCLEFIRLSSINVERIWPHQCSNKSFCTHDNLTTLIIEGCGNLKHLLSLSMARSLVNLKNLQIVECKCLREIIVSEEKDIDNEVVIFPQLNSLKMKNLQDLIGFCSEDYNIVFASLKLLEIEQCPTLKGFIYESKTEDNQPLHPQAFFDEKVAFPSLEKLRIAHLRNMKMIWHNQLPVNSFCKLMEMTVEHCNELVSIFPCDMWSTFQGPEILRVHNCGSLEEIFDVQSLNMEETHAVATGFRKLYIKDLPKLKHVWSKDLGGILTFQNLTVVQVWGCWNLKNVFPASTARVLPQLKDLDIRRCGVVEIVAKEEESYTWISFEFDQLSSVTLWNLPELKCFYPGTHTTKVPVLKNLKARHIKKLAKMFDTNMNDFVDYGQQDFPIQRNPPLFSLEKVGNQGRELLSDFSKSMDIVKENFLGSNSNFTNLQVLEVFGCSSLTYIFTTSMALSLIQLSEIKVINCAMMQQIIRNDGAEEVTLSRIMLPGLKSITLESCSSLTSFFLGSNTLECSALQKMTTVDCPEMFEFTPVLPRKQDMERIGGVNRPFFNDKVAFPSLEKLRIARLRNMKMIWHNQLPVNSFCKLTEMTVEHCNELVNIFPCDMWSMFERLETLRVSSCRSLEEIFEAHSLNMEERHAVATQFRELYIKDLPKLKHVWSEAPRGILTFQNLSVAQVWDCCSLKNLFPASTARVLPQLKDLDVRRCRVKEIVAKEEETDTWISFEFDQLSSFTLLDLPELKCFYPGMHTIKWPVLKRLKVWHCDKLVKIFGMNMNDFADYGQQDFPIRQHPQFFMIEKVGNQGGELLSDFSKSIDIWKGNVQPNSNFTNLQVLDIEDYSSLTYIFTISMALSLAQLNEIKVKSCPMMKQIIRNEGADQEATISRIMLPMLRSITLESCPSLNCLFHGSNTFECPSLRRMTIVDCPKMFEFVSAFPRKRDMERIEGVHAPFFNDKISCPNLEYLKLSSLNIQKIWPNQRQVTSYNVQNLRTFDIKGCHSLKYILPSSLCEMLVQLDELMIEDCANVEEVICTERLMTETQTQLIEAESTTKFVFPNITELVLDKLPKLKCFYSKIHTTEWPLLEELRVIGCNKVETFARDVTERQGESQLEIFQQPLFWVNEDSFPNLERLYLKENHGIMEEICHGQLPTKYFPKLSWLKLGGFPKNAVTLPNCFIQSLPNLKKLKVSTSSFNEIFECEGLSRLKKVKLSKLPELTHLWKEGIPPAEVFGNLITLKVFGCGKLENVLVPSSVPFKNLTTLAVSECHGLKNLVTLPTVRSMMLLEKLSVTDCQMMKEIIASTTDDEVMDGVIFSQLKSLELGSLPSLSWFCSGNYTFGFPSLEKLIMKQCPKMESFSEGELSTPMLQGVRSTRFGKYVGCWEGDLNAIIRQLFVEKVFPSMEDFEQSSINIQRIWHWKFLAASSYAQNLTCLTVEGCPNLKCLFSSSMVRSFVQLKMLHIDNCENVETVIFMERSEEAELMSQTSFRLLESLLLKELPRLTRFCSGSYIEFPLLRFLRIQSCSTLTTFISDSVMGNGAQIDQEAKGNNLEIASPVLFSEKVALLSLEEVSITGVGKWRKIWHDQSTNSVRIHFAN